MWLCHLPDMQFSSFSISNFAFSLILFNFFTLCNTITWFQCQHCKTRYTKEINPCPLPICINFSCSSSPLFHQRNLPQALDCLLLFQLAISKAACEQYGNVSVVVYIDCPYSFSNWTVLIKEVFFTQGLIDSS